MSASTAAQPLTFEKFWRWLQDHPNCVVRVTADAGALMDHDLVHWDFFEEEDGRCVVQSLVGKGLVGEVVIEPGEVLFVQAAPDLENPSSGYWVFECLGGNREESFPLYAFTLSHGMESAAGHAGLKH